jgi:hypothetical protein
VAAHLSHLNFSLSTVSYKLRWDPELNKLLWDVSCFRHKLVEDNKDSILSV